MTAGLAVAALALMQGRRDRQWFHTYSDCMTRFEGQQLSNSKLRDYLKREYFRPLLVPVCTLTLAVSISLGVRPTIALLSPIANESIRRPIDNVYIQSCIAVEISFAAAIIARRRSQKRVLPTVSPPPNKIVPLPSRYGPQRIRGAVLVTLEDAVARQSLILPKGDPGILWGPVCLRSDRCEHFFILATTRGGKSILLRLVMQDTLYKVGNPLASVKQRARAIMYDPKPELFPYASAIQPYAPYIFTNPADLRGRRWDLAKDFADLASAQELARLLVPIHLKQHDTFYPKAIRALLTQVFKAFMLSAPGEWTLRDVFEVFKSEDDLRHLLNRHDQTRGALERISRNPETRGNIDISIFVELEPYQILAARWHHADASFSLSEWMQSESVLVVGRLMKESHLFDALNALLLNRASELLISQPDAPPIRTYMYLDELPTAAGFTSLETLMTNGLSKFVSVVLCAQGVEGLKEQFGENKAQTILSMCSNKAFLCLDSRISAEWAANQIGKTDWLEVYDNWSYTSGYSSTSGHSTSHTTVSGSSATQHTTSSQASYGYSTSKTSGSAQQRNERYAQMPEQFQHIAKPDPTCGVGLQGTFISDSGSGYGIVPAQIPADALFNTLLMSPDLTAPAFIPRPAEHDVLLRWTDEDRKRLGFPPSETYRTPLDTFF